MKKLIITMMAIAFSLSAFSAKDNVTLLGEYEDFNKPNIYAWCVGGMVVATVSFSDSLIDNPLSAGNTFQLLNNRGSPMSCSEYN